MVFSAPEITTVSKPNRNPARADVSDQKKMRAFIGERRSLPHNQGDSLQNQEADSSIVSVNLSPADILFRASPECRHPWKSRWYNPSSAGYRQRGQSGN